MSELKSLTLTQFQAKNTPVSPVQMRRDKLSSKIAEQLAAAQAMAAGERYSVKRVRRVKTDEGVKLQERAGKFRQWFRQLDDKRWAVVLMYGSRQLEFSKGKNAVEAGSVEAVITVLETLRRAVAAGELDAQLEQAAAVLKRGFKK
jgi:hypothetical protein